MYSAGDVVAESLTTGTDGQVVLSDLHLGTYVVTEIKSIDGYTINTTPQTVAVEYKDQTVTVQYESATIENTRQKADVSVVKKDSDTENPLDGGKYTLYAGNDIKNYAGQVIVTKGTALETVSTGEDGKASYSVDLPISNGYYVSETQAPYAYIRNSKDVYSFNFNVLPETQAKASFSHTFVNDRTTAKIHIYKVDKESGKAAAQGDASLEGAVYGLYARNDIVHPDGATGVVFKAGDLLLYKYIGLTGSAYVAIPCVAPIALGGFYSFNGMNFYEYMGKKLHFMFGNRALTYVSTEGEPAIKQLEAEQNEQVKKKGRKAEPETVTADSAVKKQEEFEAMKKKTRNMLLGLVAVIVAAVAGIAAYKAMH